MESLAGYIKSSCGLRARTGRMLRRPVFDPVMRKAMIALGFVPCVKYTAIETTQKSNYNFLTALRRSKEQSDHKNPHSTMTLGANNVWWPMCNEILELIVSEKKQQCKL